MNNLLSIQLSCPIYLDILSNPSLCLLLFRQRSSLLFFQLKALLIATYTEHTSQSLWPHRSQIMRSLADELSIVTKGFVGNTVLERNVESLFLLLLFIHSFSPSNSLFSVPVHVQTRNNISPGGFSFAIPSDIHSPI